jgi:hypothetical protein
MASPAILSIDNLQHVDLVASGFELEAEITVADLAAETDAVKPMREDDGPHARFVRELVNDDVSILGIGRFVKAEGKYRCQDCDGYP